MQSDCVRRLISIPVIHTQADLGSLSEAVRQLYIRRMGARQWNHRLKTVDEMWRGISREIKSLNLDYSKVRLYQDGLPHCGHEQAIIKDMAQAGSQNHRLLLHLMEKGARIVGTESPELLLEEYELARQTLASLSSGKKGELSNRGQDGAAKLLLEKRDRYIAQRINDTLAVGETGLVFLGLLHSLLGRLPPDIKATEVFKADKTS